jgi:hypothetical protein
MSIQEKRKMLSDLLGVSTDEMTDEQVENELFKQLENPDNI